MLLEFLASWLSGTLLTEGVRLSASHLEKAINDFQENPTRYGWDRVLSERDQRLLNALKKTTPANWKKYFLHGPLSESRPIVIWGPSGTGKSIIANRLAGKQPKYAPQSSSRMERAKIVAGWRGHNILTAPGSSDHDEDGSISQIKNTLISTNPPRVFCFVVALGYHATAASFITGSFKRPYSEGTEVAENIDRFRSRCFEEELELLTEIRRFCSGRMKKRVPLFLTIINKRDLWDFAGGHSEMKERYINEDSNYCKLVSKICDIWGLGNLRATHERFPTYSFAGGFHPDNTIPSRALTTIDSEADAMLLRALIYYHFTEGAGA